MQAMKGLILILIIVNLTGCGDDSRLAPTAPVTSAAVSHVPGSRVVIAGGNGAVASVVIYDAATGLFTATVGAIHVAGYSHTASALRNGKVLIAGGNYGGVLSSAEIYDPWTGSFTATGSMNFARSYHTASVLANGTVLIVGGNGIGVGAYLSSAEIYDPDTGLFTATGSMPIARSSHTASVLSYNGKVLIVGGNGAGGDLSSAEIYDPATELFSLTGPILIEKRFKCKCSQTKKDLDDKTD